jgi:ornithine decarboxylase
MGMANFAVYSNTQPVGADNLPTYSSVEHMVHQLKPENPVHCLRPEMLKRAASWFLSAFPGRVMYAVKTNPEPFVIQSLYAAGVKDFDVASLAEVALVRTLLPEANLYFMHPVKNRPAIRESYYKHGVRDFAVDSCEELKKILEETDHANDLGIHVRLALPKGSAAHDLSGKFGVNKNDAPRLIKQARKVSRRLGICFHVGSQAMDPESYCRAISLSADVVKAARVSLDVLDVGGGFPSIYPGMTPPDLSIYMQKIREAMANEPSLHNVQLWCEPGRALVAEAGSLIVRVELRKGQQLYINDGVYGSLFDAGLLGLSYPVKIIRPKGRISGNKIAPFSFFGPTCDSLDAMQGPFYLPSTVREGDWIEIGQLGAYGATLQSRFNGFYTDQLVAVHDAPLLSMYS